MRTARRGWLNRLSLPDDAIAAEQKRKTKNVVYVGTCRLGCSTAGTVTGNTAGNRGAECGREELILRKRGSENSGL